MFVKGSTELIYFWCLKSGACSITFGGETIYFGGEMIMPF
jgi:hypothetical protein